MTHTAEELIKEVEHQRRFFKEISTEPSSRCFLTTEDHCRYNIVYVNDGIHSFSSCKISEIVEYMYEHKLRYDDLSDFQVIISDLHLIRKFLPAVQPL